MMSEWTMPPPSLSLAWIGDHRRLARPRYAMPGLNRLSPKNLLSGASRSSVSGVRSNSTCAPRSSVKNKPSEPPAIQFDDVMSPPYSPPCATTTIFLFLMKSRFWTPRGFRSAPSWSLIVWSRHDGSGASDGRAGAGCAYAAPPNHPTFPRPRRAPRLVTTLNAASTTPDGRGTHRKVLSLDPPNKEPQRRSG